MSLKVSFLKGIDALAGSVAVRMLSAPAPEKIEPATLQRFLVIRPGGIGDAVLLIPFLLAVRTRFPQAEITVLAERRNGGVFNLCPQIDHLLLYDRPSELFKAIFGGYDLVIDTEQWHRLSAVVARLTSAPVLLGYATNERSKMFTHSVCYSHDDYEAESFSHLLAPLGMGPVQIPERFLTMADAAVSNAAELLQPLAGKPFVALFPGASIPERRWGAERFRQLAELLSGQGFATVVVGGGEDREQGEMIVSGGAGLNLAGRTSLPETAAVIEQSALLVSGDSGILHIAVGLGKPTVSLFGPGRARKWAPKGERHRVINKALPCSPCTTFGTTPACPIQAQCMTEIKVGEVLAAVAMLLGSAGAIRSKQPY